MQKNIEWLDQNQLAEKAVYDAKLKDLEEFYGPFLKKINQNSSSSGNMPDMGDGDAAHRSSNSGPNVVEVD